MCRYVLLVIGGLLLGGWAFGCGASAPPPQAPAAEAVPAEAPAAEESQSLPAPAPPPEPAPALAPAPAASEPARGNALEGEDELARAEQELAAADRELSAANAASKPAKSEQHDSSPGRGAGAGAAKPKSSASSQNACATTCKAFASLLRARDSICRIAGDDGERCTRANEIVERHTPRSTSCGCGS